MLCPCCSLHMLLPSSSVPQCSANDLVYTLQWQHRGVEQAEIRLWTKVSSGWSSPGQLKENFTNFGSLSLIIYLKFPIWNILPDWGLQINFGLSGPALKIPNQQLNIMDFISPFGEFFCSCQFTVYIAKQSKRFRNCFMFKSGECKMGEFSKV